jgi:hypothetical protein
MLMKLAVIAVYAAFAAWMIYKGYHWWDGTL